MGKLAFQKQAGGSCAHGFFEEDGLPVFKTDGFVTRESANAFARRLVASFNLCAEIPVEALEVLPLNFKEHAEELERLKAQNAQLLEALEEITSERDFIGARMVARAAIAAATEKTT